jgi:microcystin-dependent protein
MDGIVGFTILFAGNFAPTDWAICDGRFLPVTQHPLLFAVIGTLYGGDGRLAFALPDLRGRAIVGAGKGISNYKHGDSGGSEWAVLEAKAIPEHTHALQVSITPQAAITANSSTPENAIYATGTNNLYSYGTPNTFMAPYNAVITTAGGGDNEPVAVLHPVLALNYIICIRGHFPRRKNEKK